MVRGHRYCVAEVRVRLNTAGLLMCAIKERHVVYLNRLSVIDNADTMASIKLSADGIASDAVLVVACTQTCRRYGVSTELFRRTARRQSNAAAEHEVIRRAAHGDAVTSVLRQNFVVADVGRARCVAL